MAISDVSVAGLDETASLLAGRGADAQRAELDVSDRLAVEEYAAVTAEHFGVVHQLYNNAGIAFSRSVLEPGYADYERLLAVNLWGVIDGTKAFLPRLVVPVTATSSGSPEAASGIKQARPAGWRERRRSRERPRP